MEAFHAHFRRIYQDRWPQLLEAMYAEVSHAPVPFAVGEPYFLDKASLCPPLALLAPALGRRHAQPLRVFDMCAAPGGKSVVLANLLSVGQIASSLVSNESSAPRCKRLKQVLSRAALPKKFGGFSSTITQQDAADLPSMKRHFSLHAFDYILIDAPCSGERHLLDNAAELLSWSPARPRTNARRQLELMLCSAHLIRPGGRVVYSTCSISPEENDMVVQNFLDKVCRNFGRYNFHWVFDKDRPVRVADSMDDVLKNDGNMLVEACGLPNGDNPWHVLSPEKTRFGWMIMPDRNANRAGPMYVAILDFCPSVRVLQTPISERLLQDDDDDDDDDRRMDENILEDRHSALEKGSSGSLATDSSLSSIES